MKILRSVVLSGCAVALLCGGVFAAGARQASRDEFAATQTDAVVHDLCDKTVALLGESPVHGFGKALDFKAGVTRRLISECHFNGFFIESGTYDFLKMEEMLSSRMPITAQMIQAAIGGIWANEETGRLIPDLLQGAQSGKLRLGGLDDQLGRGTYAQRDMPADLVQSLDGTSKAECRSILERHTQYQYSSDAPYGPQDNARIVGCLDRIGAAASKTTAGNTEYDLAMVANLKRLLARDFPASPPRDANVQGSNERDRSTYQNFQWLQARMPPGSKVIVWTATTHAAKDLRGVPGNQAVSMGSFIHSALGERAFALGFSEYSGSYAFARQPAKTLDIAPDDSLEAKAFAGNDLTLRYFSLKDLRALGPIAARPLGVTFKTAKWDDVLDGLIVFREEHPPTLLAGAGGK
jgi:erythromycin esterase-like protein